MTERPSKKAKGKQRNDGIPEAKDLFTSQPLLALLIQMSYLDDESLSELCRVNTRVKKICKDPRQRARVYRERFDRAFGEDADELAAKKDDMFGAAYSYVTFYKNAVTALECLTRIEEENEENDEDYDIVNREFDGLNPDQFLIFLYLSYRWHPDETNAHFAETVNHPEFGAEVVEYIGADGKIFNGQNFANAVLAFADDTALKHLAVGTRIPLKALLVAYRQLPEHPAWIEILTAVQDPNADWDWNATGRIAWLAREIDEAGNLSAELRVRVAKLIYKRVGEVTAADLDWKKRTSEKLGLDKLGF